MVYYGGLNRWYFCIHIYVALRGIGLRMVVYVKEVRMNKDEGQYPF